MEYHLKIDNLYMFYGRNGEWNFLQMISIYKKIYERRVFTKYRVSQKKRAPKNPDK